MKNTSRQPKPLARKDGLVIQELPGEVLVYDLERDRAHCLNETAAFVWQRCDGRRTVHEIAGLLEKKVSAKVDEKVVWLALDQLSRNELLARRAVPPPALAGINRRQMVRALGLAAIVAVPVVTSIVAPSLAQVVSCGHTGATCTGTGQGDCCFGCVCTGTCTGTCP